MMTRNEPRIQKLGTIDLNLVETTPVVFRNRLLRLEYIRKNYQGNQLGKPYHRFMDVVRGQPLPPFAEDRDLGSAVATGDGVNVFVTRGWGGGIVDRYYSHDLQKWRSEIALSLPGWSIFNTSACATDSGFVLAFEISSPPEETGIPFTIRFARSKDLHSWELTPPECVYAKDRFTACPTLRFFDGFFYMTYVEAKLLPQGRTGIERVIPGTLAEHMSGFDCSYETHIVRSSDLVHWENSPLNPILVCSDGDKKINNPCFTATQKEQIDRAVNLNNSDIDYCEWNGQTVIYYSWGDQHGTEFLAHAACEGPLNKFLQGYFRNNENTE